MSALSNRTVATIGSGVMAESIIAGLLRGKLVEPDRIVGSEPRADRREELAAKYGVRVVASNLEAARDADVILLSVKPQTLTKVGHELGGHLRAEQLIVSIVAGANCNVLTNLLDHRQVVRSMPNTPAQIGRGVTVWYATPEVTEMQCDQARVLLRALGTELQVEDERFVEMATAVSGTPSTSGFRGILPTTWSSRRWRAVRPSPRPPLSTLPSCATWSLRRAGPVPLQSTNWNPAGSGPCCRKRSGLPTDELSIWAPSWRRGWD